MDMPAPSPVSVRVLGGFELNGAGGEVTLAGRKLRALVALLALPPSLGWSREQLTALLWGDRDEELGRGSLRQALAELRRVLGEQALLVDRDTVAFDRHAVRIDAAEFTALSKEENWEKAATLYRGDLLAGVSLPNGSFADWLQVERTHLRDLAVKALSRLLTARAGEAAMATATQLLVLDPTHEPTHRALMRLHAARGNRAQAIRQYQACRDTLQRDLAVKPDAETERLLKEIQASTTPRHSAPADSAAPSSLPSSTPSLALPANVVPIAATSPRRRLMVAAILVLIALVGALAWPQPWQPAPPQEPPSLAVLPFANISDDPQQAYFAAGIADDLMTDLSRVPGLFVIARNSSAAFADARRDLRDVARELGVRYLVDGSVRRAGDQVRINVQLIDATTGRQQWAQRYDGSLADIFALQDQVTSAVGNALALRIATDGARESAARETASPQAYDAFLRGWEHFRRTVPDELLKAQPHFEQAITLDSEYGRAHAALAMIYFLAYDQGWSGQLGLSANDAYRQARDHLKVAQRRPTSTSHQVAGSISRGLGWYEDALKEFHAATALDPNDSWSYAYAAHTLISAGRLDEAEAELAAAMKLDPHPPPIFHFYRGWLEFAHGRLEKAAAAFEIATRLDPANPWPWLYLVATYGGSGKLDQAQRSLAEFNALRIAQGGLPLTLDCDYFRSTAFSSPAGSLSLEHGLRLAGVPRQLSDLPQDQQKLSAADIEALFFGHYLHGRSLETGQEHGVFVAPDGSAMMFGDWGYGTGIARFEGDELCFEWTGGYVNCGTIYRNPGGTRRKDNEFIWSNHIGGIYPFSQID
jgi:TolB-like protein/DNA-binding SARP family transcriptional activator/Tfp pilus assembly protein PilF